MAVQLQLLGLPRLSIDGELVTISWPRRSLSLLTLLYTSRGAQSRDAAAFALWPDEDEEAARANLRRNLNLLRSALPPEAAAWIVSDAAFVEFRHAHADTDIATFLGPSSRPDDLRRCVAAYGGDFAAALDEPWVVVERERLRNRFHHLLMLLVGIEFSARRFDAALGYARRICADEPLREDVVRRIMSIRYAMGDRPGALLEFERFARSLHVEMGIEPMPETVGLRDLVLRGESLPFAPDASADLSPLPEARAATLWPFCGRRVALERLESAWSAARAGRVVFVAGEAGIGKSRTVAEFLERTVGTSARILRGTTASPEARPYEAFLHALANAAAFVPMLDLEPVWLAALAPLVPEIAAHALVAPAPAAVLPSEREGTRLFEALTRFIRALARTRPVVVVLEDLHWSGAGTLEALRYVAARLTGSPVLLIATYRTGEQTRLEALVRELGDGADRIELGRLRPDETRDVLAAAQPPLSEAAAEELARRSEGHPLFLIELLRDDPLARADQRGGIAELIAGRLGRCSGAAQTLARIAAVCGTTFDLDLLQHVAGWDEGAAIDGLAELIGRQFIRSTASHERGSYAFSHALVQAAVRNAIDAQEQRRMHRFIARVLENREPGGRYDVEVAEHWAFAGDVQAAAAAYLRAAQAGLNVHAREEAADLAGRGLALMSDSTTEAALRRVRIEANLRRTSASVLRSDAIRLSELTSSAATEARFATALLAFRIEEIAGDEHSRGAALEALRQFARAAAPLQAAQIADAGARHALLSGTLEAASEYAANAVKRYTDCGATSDALRVAIFAARVRVRSGDPARAHADIRLLEPRIGEFADPSLTMEYWLARANIAHVRRDSEATLHAAERLRDLAEKNGDRLTAGHAALLIATAFQHASALGRAIVELDRAEAIYGSIGVREWQQTARINRGSLLFQIGRIAESAALLREEYDAANTDGAVQQRYFAASNLGCALLALGRSEDALRLQTEALTRARAIGSEGFAALALGDLGAAEVATGDRSAGLAHLLEASHINTTLKRTVVAAHDLARAAGATPDAHSGAGYARRALGLIAAEPHLVALAPEIFARCAAALDRAADAAAAAYCRQRGADVLAARLAVLDGADRDHHAALFWHRQLLGAVTPQPAAATLR